MKAPLLSYMLAVEVINGKYTIDQIPPLLQEDVATIVKEMTGKDVGEE